MRIKGSVDFNRAILRFTVDIEDLFLEQSSSNLWNFPSEGSNRGVFGCVEVTFGKPRGHLRVGLVAWGADLASEGGESSVSAPDFREFRHRLSDVSSRADVARPSGTSTGGAVT